MPELEYSPELANTIFKEDAQPAVSSPATEIAASGNEPKTETSTQVLAEEPAKTATETKTETAEPEKKSKLDRLGRLQQKKQEPDPKAAAQPEKPRSNEENIRVLREAKQEWDKTRPLYEKLQADYATRETEMGSLREELTKLKAMGLNEQERADYQRYRDLYAVDAVKSSQEFQQNILAPIQAVEGDLNDIAKRAGLDDKGANALFEAVNTPNKFDRAKAIRAVLKDVDMDIEDYQTYVDAASLAANRLHEDLYPRHDAILAQADEVQRAARDQESQHANEAKLKDETDFKTNLEGLVKQLSEDNFKMLLEDTNLNIDGTTLAEAMKAAQIANDPQERAWQSIAGASLPFVVQWAQRILDENNSLKDGQRAKAKASPSLRDGSPVTPTAGDGKITLEDMLRSVR